MIFSYTSPTDRTLHLKERGCDIPLQQPALLGDGPREFPVQVAATVEVPPRSALLVKGTTAGAGVGLWLLEETPKKELPIAVAQGLMELESSSVVLQILEDPVKLYRGMEVGVLQRVEDPAGYEVGAVDESQETVTELDKQEMLQALFLSGA